MNSTFRNGSRLIATVSLVLALFANSAFAGMNHETAISTPAVSGYDPVAYFEQGRPVRGSGYHTATHQGATYLFATKEHREKFKAHPEKYAPQYGGYCAYGVSVGKKFYSDPSVWKIVDGKLYLNLDRDIQKKWNADISGHINTANANWTKIHDKAPSEL